MGKLPAANSSRCPCADPHFNSTLSSLMPPIRKQWLTSTSEQRGEEKNPILFILLWSYFSQHHLFPFTVYKARGVKYALLILVLIIAIKSKRLKMWQKKHWVLMNLHLSGTVKCLYMTFCRPENKTEQQQQSGTVPYEQPAGRPAVFRLQYRWKIWPAPAHTN